MKNKTYTSGASIGVLTLAAFAAFSPPSHAKELSIRSDGQWYKGVTAQSECRFAGGCATFDRNCNGHEVLSSHSNVKDLNADYYAGKTVKVFETKSSSEMCTYKQ